MQAGLELSLKVRARDRPRRSTCRRRAAAHAHRALALVAVVVLLPAQRAVMIGIAAGEILAEPLIAFDVSRRQAAFAFFIQCIEVGTRRIRLLHCALSAIWAHHVIAGVPILACARR
jgi:hypothetical protein